MRRVIEFPVPVVGMIEGSVWGGACDLAMTCDILVGTPTATFAITPAKLGIAYNTAGLNHFIGVVPGHIIREMLFTGNPISPQDAHRLGLLNHLVEAGTLEETTLEICRTIAARAPLVVRLLKRELRRLTAGPAADARTNLKNCKASGGKPTAVMILKRACKPSSRSDLPLLPGNKHGGRVPLTCSFRPYQFALYCSIRLTL